MRVHDNAAEVFIPLSEIAAAVTAARGDECTCQGGFGLVVPLDGAARGEWDIVVVHTPRCPVTVGSLTPKREPFRIVPNL